MTLDDLSAALDSAATAGALWPLLTAFARERGVRMVSYHHYLGAGSSARERGFDLRAEGFPEAWVCRYIEARLWRIDPIPDRALHRVEPFLWSEVGELGELDPEERRFLALREAAVPGDGLAVPVFGPEGRDGYVGLGFGSSLPPLSRRVLRELQSAAEMGHLAYCALVPAPAVALRERLAPREREVLDWLAKGKTNPEIAAILGLSRHTVGTLVRRLFDKLDVHDRVSAALLGSGGARIDTVRRI